MFAYLLFLYAVPIVVLICGYPRLGLWLGSWLTMFIVWMFATYIGAMVGYFDEMGPDTTYNTFTVLTPCYEWALKIKSLFRMALALPWAVFFDAVQNTWRLQWHAMSGWIFFFQAIGTVANLLLWGLTAGVVKTITARQQLAAYNDR